MVSKLKEVIWSKEAVEELEEIHEYLKKRSEWVAKKVIHEILIQTAKLNRDWNLCEKDELKDGNDGSYKVIFVYHFRITYRIKAKQIHVLRVRHTSREPLAH